MSGISGISSIINNIMYPSNGITPKAAASASPTDSSDALPAWSDEMTISQIRDNVDAMATSGQLTGKQQMALIDAGLQDLNAYDKSYQPSDPSVGLNRQTSGTFDPAAIMLQKSTFATEHGGNDLAKVEMSLASIFAHDENRPTLNITA
jgi:hypothetical protein